MKLKRKLFLWAPVVIWCGVIFLFSSIPTLPAVGFDWTDFLAKKTAHLTEYAILYLLIMRALKNNYQLKAISYKLILLAFIFGLLYAISDELHQRFVMGRTSRARDVAIDFLGLSIGWYLYTRKQNWLARMIPEKWL
ncbi:hypothetical protein A2160_03235 [Candidatus Beckwithbacteria bacterium RBG_13_42_9]|uniref:VanZ-like domain-containing protein n=1 Tax=Candidatus Beckwithbacteria bacterium RBG_13_42_9 TaxID=1797457 RepID=A0A1F5E7R8_9BACT|nr:MAG: hypothetical protein A2160_03235 [Candidatus Beckwithbacteria bacterium RBG_13_42_9]